MNIRIIDCGLTAGEYVNIKDSAKWGEPLKFEHAKTALEKSLFHVVARDGDKAVGMGRLLGDGIFYWHFQDIIILPEYQGMGIGKMVMERLIGYIRTHSPRGKGINTGLMAAKDKEGFYEKLGFISRPSKRFGSGMSMRIDIPEKE